MIHITEGFCAIQEKVDENTIYFGYPKQGTISESSPAWAIKRMRRIPGTDKWITEWANGMTECTLKWCCKDGYSYSFPK